MNLAIALPLPRASVCLPDGQVLSLTDAAGVELAPQSGRVWVTMEGDYRDIVLAPGAAYRIERDGLTLVKALEPSLVRVDIPGARRASWRDRAERVWDWLVRFSEARARARMARGRPLL